MYIILKIKRIKIKRDIINIKFVTKYKKYYIVTMIISSNILLFNLFDSQLLVTKNYLTETTINNTCNNNKIHRFLEFNTFFFFSRIGRGGFAFIFDLRD